MDILRLFAILSATGGTVLGMIAFARAREAYRTETMDQFGREKESHAFWRRMLAPVAVHFRPTNKAELELLKTQLMSAGKRSQNAVDRFCEERIVAMLVGLVFCWVWMAAVGGGFGLSLVCDIRIANEKAKYGANFTKLGLSSGMAISYLLPRIVGVSKACELLFTAALIDGKEGEKIGFCSTALPGKEVLPYAEQLAETIAKNAPLAVQYTKRNIYSGLGWAPSNAAYQESFTQSQTLTTDDASEGIKALLEKRVPTFTGR